MAPPAVWFALQIALQVGGCGSKLGYGTQELRAFLELEGPLADNYQWRQLHPLQGSLMEGLSRLPKQLLGAQQNPTSACCVQILR